jgi:outer membrane receptor protein involved in Fe transport
MRASATYLAEPFACIAVLCLAATPAAAQDVAFDIPAGRLSDALVSLGEQAGITIGASDLNLASVRSRQVRGRMTIRQALSRLLAGTGYQFAFVAPGTVRVTRIANADATAAPRRIIRPAPPPPPPPETQIVVTGSKQQTPLENFAGTVRMIDIGSSDVGRFGVRGTEGLVARLPMLSSTSLGTGRNKVFIRGIADSSFNGPSQTLVGQYLGDVRLTYNAPDPDLQHYDFKRVEVLEGPQGTLYGAGSLGGIMRLIPNSPDPSSASAGLSGGLLATQHGEFGRDFSAMANLPIERERLTLRAVVYGASEGGYIDDAGRSERNVNRVGVHGGRAALLWTPSDEWQIELTGLAQFIGARDGQYAERGLPPLVRRSSFAQPFENDYQLGALTLRRRTRSIELISTTSLVRHDLETEFDATEPVAGAPPQLFAEDVALTLFTHETRLSRPAAGGAGWVLGFGLLHNTGEVHRRIGPPAAMLPIANARNETTEVAAFGQTSIPINDHLTATLGGRLSIARSDGTVLDTDDDLDEPARTDFQVSPTAALSWRAGDDVLLYTRYQKGFRVGGLAVFATGSGTAAERYESDRLTTVEAGIRLGNPGTSSISLNAALSYAWWGDIQADLIDERGLPYTTNLGDGGISGIEVEASWQVTPKLRLDAAAFLNGSSLTDPAPAFAAADETDLPNIAAAGGRIGANFRAELAEGADLSVDGAINYVGSSQLGIGAPLDVSQGDYFDSQIGARIGLGRLGISVDVDNLLNGRGNRFAFGNPFRLESRSQVTPLRPRTIRVGMDVAF